MMKADGNAAAMVYTDPIYSRAVTQELVDLFYGNGVLAVKLIFFNDAAVTGVQHFAQPFFTTTCMCVFTHRASPAPTPCFSATRRAPRYENCNAVCGYWSAHNANPFPAPAVDGDFGQNTFDAIVAVQNAAHLPADGRAGDDVWRVLPKVR